MQERMVPFRMDDGVDPFGAVSELALEGDLRLLMRGPGAQPGQEMSRIGAALRTMCGIASSDSTIDAIGAVAAWLRSRISTLDSEVQRTCALRLFGLHETARLPRSRARLAVAADVLGKSSDTVRRHGLAAVTAIARATPPGQTVPLQLRRQSGHWVDLGIAQGSGGDDVQDVLTARCYLLAVARPADQPDKVYAVVEFTTDQRVRLAIPAVRVRHVKSVPSDGIARDDWTYER